MVSIAKNRGYKSGRWRALVYPGYGLHEGPFILACARSWAYLLPNFELGVGLGFVRCLGCGLWLSDGVGADFLSHNVCSFNFSFVGFLLLWFP